MSRRLHRIAPVTCLLGLAGVTGCGFTLPPGLFTNPPPLSDFDIPAGATATRVLNGTAIVFAQPNGDASSLDLFFIEPNQSADEADFLGSVPRDDFGFPPDQPVSAPATLSFDGNFQNGVIGFEDESFVLQTAGPPLPTFVVAPMTAFNSPVRNPAISPLGDRVGFQMDDGTIGIGGFDQTGIVLEPATVGTGINPIFGPSGAMGFSSPDFDQFFVSDFSQMTVSTFTTANFAGMTFPSAFDTFEAGFTPNGIGGIGIFSSSAPLVLNSPPFNPGGGIARLIVAE